MKIGKINTYNYANNISKTQMTKPQISFGEYTSDGFGDMRPWLKGHMYDLVMYRPHSNPFNIQNRSKKGQYSRFLLNPKDENFSKLAIIVKPGSKIETKSGPWFFIQTQRSDEAYKYKVKDGKIENLTQQDKQEKFVSSKGELEIATKLFNPMNPKKGTKENHMKKQYND